MHPLDEELESYRTGRMSPGSSSVVKSHLSECSLCASKLQQLSERLERRSHARTSTDQPATVNVVRPSAKPMSGQVIEVSEAGLKLSVSEAMEPGALVQVRLANKFVLAEVRYCLRQGHEFHVGIETKEVFDIPGK